MAHGRGPGASPGEGRMVTVYYDRDARVEDLSGETVAVIGYGIQGRAHDLSRVEKRLRELIRLER